MVASPAVITSCLWVDRAYPAAFDTPRAGLPMGEGAVHGRFDTTQRCPTCPMTEKVDC
jgi:hypothetical protein